MQERLVMTTTTLTTNGSVYSAMTQPALTHGNYNLPPLELTFEPGCSMLLSPEQQDLLVSVLTHALIVQDNPNNENETDLCGCSGVMVKLIGDKQYIDERRWL